MDPHPLTAEETTTSFSRHSDGDGDGDGDGTKTDNDSVIVKELEGTLKPPHKDPRLRLPTKLEKFFAYYGQWTSSSTTTEQGVKLAQWIVWLLSQLTKNTKSILGDHEDEDEDHGHYQKNVSPALRKLYNNLSTMRYILRFYGMPSALDGALTGSWASSAYKDARIKQLSYVMAWSMVIYYPLEHLAFVKWNMPKFKIFKRIDGNKMSAWSCRFWLLYIVGDWISSYLKNCELREERKRLLLQNGEDVNEESQSKSKELVQELDNSMYMNKLQMIRCALFSAPCVSWSLDDWATNPWLSENVAHGLFLTESIVSIYQSILSLKKV